MTAMNLPGAHQAARAEEARAPEFFAPEQTLSTTSIEEAQAACETVFHYTRKEISLAQIFLEDDLTLGFNGDRYRLTEPAFDDLCRALAVPVAFAKGIPADLVARIAARLSMLHQQTIVPVCREDVVVGIVDPLKWTGSRAKTRRPHYEPVPGGRLLQVIKNIRTDVDDTPHVTIADSGLCIEVLDRERVVEPRVGDLTRIGVAVTSSETGGPMPQARGCAVRLICTNGATAPTTFGVVRFSTDWRVKSDVRLRAFETALRDFSVDLDLLRSTYKRLASETVTDQLFYSLYRQMRYIYRHVPDGERLAHNALGVEPQQRRQIIAQVRRRQAGARDGQASVEPPQPTGLGAWDVFNAVTTAAREEPYRRRVALERLGGDLLGAYAPRTPN
jgi:hypothetical protein